MFCFITLFRFLNNCCKQRTISLIKEYFLFNVFLKAQYRHTLRGGPGFAWGGGGGAQGLCARIHIMSAKGDVPYTAWVVNLNSGGHHLRPLNSPLYTATLLVASEHSLFALSKGRNNCVWISKCIIHETGSEYRSEERKGAGKGVTFKPLI